MQRIAGVMAACGVLAGAAVPVTAQTESLHLAPASVWVMDYAEDSCALRRDFGTVENLVSMEMRQFEPGRLDYQFIVASAHHRLANRNRARNVAIRFHPDNEPSDAVAAFNMEFPNDVTGVTFSTSLFAHQFEQLDEIDGWEERAAASEALQTTFDRQTREREVTAIELINVFRPRFVLETGSLGAPMQAMQTCLEELLTHWGVDAMAHRTLLHQARPLDMQAWARRVSNVYPAAMANDGAQAVLRIRLDVTTDGRAGGCHMQTRLGQEDFERTACDLLLQHARFLPAIDANGAAIASYYVLTVVYSMG